MSETTRAPRARKLAPTPAPTALAEPEPLPIPSEEPTAAAGAAPSRDPRELDFFDYLAQLTPAQWDERLCYVYRQDPGVTKENGKRFIAKVPHAFDEQWIKDRFGGGRFLVYLKNVEKGEHERKHSFEIDGERKLSDGEVIVGARTVAAPSDSGDAPKESASDKDAVARVAQTMQRGTEAVIDVMSSVMAKQAGSASGNPIIDKLVEKALDRLNAPPPAPVDPTESLVKALALVERLGAVRQQSNPSLKDTLGELRETFGIDPAQLLRPVGSPQGTDWGQVIMGALPQVLQVGRELLATWRMSTERQYQIAVARAQQVTPGQAPQYPPAPTPEQPAYPSTQSPQPTAPPADPTGGATTAAASAGTMEPMMGPGRLSDGSLDFDYIRQAVVRHYRADRSGDFVAALFKEMWPDQLQLFAAAFGDADQVQAFSASDPILQEIAGEADYPSFVSDFCGEMAAAAEPAPEPAEGPQLVPSA